MPVNCVEFHYKMKLLFYSQVKGTSLDSLNVYHTISTNEYKHALVIT